MQLFTRNILVQAFRLPLWGQVADEIPPAWLVRRLQSSELAINRLGGLTMNTQWGVQSCAAGDFVLLTEDDQIQFATPDEFEKLEPAEELQQAA